MQILVDNETMRKDLGFSSKKHANKFCRDFESLRNNLTHAQDIVTYDFTQIARLVQCIESMQ